MHTNRIVLTTALVPFAASAAAGSFLITHTDADDATPPPAVTAPPTAKTAPPTRPAPVPPASITPT